MRIDQGFANMTGWKELAAKTREVYNQIPDDEKQSTLLFCDNYGFAGAINYYNRGKVPEAYSLSTDYIFWIPRYPVIRNIIWIGGYSKHYLDRSGTRIYLLSQPKTDVTPVFYKMIEEKKKTMDIFYGSLLSVLFSSSSNFAASQTSLYHSSPNLRISGSRRNS